MSLAAVLRRELPGDLEPADVLLRLRADRHPFALDGHWSCGSVLGSEPVWTRGPGDPLTDVLGDRCARPGNSGGGTDGGFHGGWVGYLGYGLGRTFDTVPPPPGPPRALPDWWFGYYD